MVPLTMAADRRGLLYTLWWSLPPRSQESCVTWQAAFVIDERCNMKWSQSFAHEGLAVEKLTGFLCS